MQIGLAHTKSHASLAHAHGSSTRRPTGHRMEIHRVAEARFESMAGQVTAVVRPCHSVPLATAMPRRTDFRPGHLRVRILPWDQDLIEKGRDMTSSSA